MSAVTKTDESGSASARFRIEAVFIDALAWIFRWLPLPMSRWLAEMLGTVLAEMVGLRRRVALNNLKLALPNLSPQQHVAVFRGCWQHFTRVAAEMARIPRIDQRFVKRWMVFRNDEVFQSALREGKGALFVSGHFGNWEWLGAGMAQRGYPVTYVVTSQTNPFAEEWLNRMRESAGIEIIPKRDAARGVLSALKRNRLVAILADQDAGEAGVFAPFFGRMASTPRGPAAFHLKTGAPIIFGGMVCRPDGRYEVSFERLKPPLTSGDRERDETTIMADLTARLEAQARSHPEQYNWLHRRWKTRPDCEKEANIKKAAPKV